MSYFDDASKLVTHSRDQLSKIRSSYQSALREKEINSDLLILIKNYMENLRSALDFAAYGIFDKYGFSSQKKPRIYFPYAIQSQSEKEFRKSNRIETCIPGLSKSRPDIVDKIESFQHFANPKNRWLPIFMDLNNENKHQQLTPQTRKESKELRLSSRGSKLALGPGAKIDLSPGASMKVGDMVIRGEQSFDSQTVPKSEGPGKKEIITWVSFSFTSHGEPVIPLLENALEGVAQIVEELSTL